ncbi:hypothetical protein UA38_11880 [Photobacterium kishitanii]|uniref:YqaJ viral recombinase domain-containing protein n=1 Tax=Photobacterium kishitanii TaxID=318456 RepID=A0AAX0YWB1_9GAMM|nr:YqaJ viral recombinase family protein [Photobacterium kishitanii]KJG57068.1 hypothetical protein UA38_11880 [Photobacterium kishitanii]KJG60594.1 hypothetical protein UA42_14675 [Photobacterium kishitanii]KJG64896.1 hypothetical protein UA40_14370 [Photobacterium kishitanii]KJG68532.1 hypothetical protein UA41_16780 [Photobacterium kishitanii]PSX18314.1 hypothetical protein C0W70_15715 [Photobacterium kishitanii]
MKIIPLKQGSDEWASWRLTVVGASELSICIGQNIYQTAKQLYMYKTGLESPPDLSLNLHIIRGRKEEPLARKYAENYFSKKYDCLTLLMPVVACSNNHDQIAASFDGICLIKDHPFYNIPVELKCPSRPVWNDIKRKGKKSPHYIMYAIQVQHQIYVADATEGYLIFYFNNEIQIFHISRNEEFLIYAINKALSFMRNVATITPPADDLMRDIYTPTSIVELDEWKKLSTDYTSVITALKTSPSSNDLLTRKLTLRDNAVQLLGLYKTAQFESFRVSRTTASSTVNYEDQVMKLVSYIKEHNLSVPVELTDSCNFTVVTESKLRINTKAKPLPISTPLAQSIQTFEVEITPPHHY